MRRLPNLLDDERVQDHDRQVGDYLDKDKLGPEDIVGNVVGIIAKGAAHHCYLLDAINPNRLLEMRKINAVAVLGLMYARIFAT